MTRHDEEEQRTKTRPPEAVPEEHGQPEPTDHQGQERPNPSTGPGTHGRPSDDADPGHS
ncbi:hypothetical protein [Deinococcus sp. QL22]|uniref:hypothetical protein n=1 Tax=Deinococcus sp. QL22 TaxID=2939437 RepID=UPI0020183402|nr:hypothetical protein [Deinococcus sp. QL22]UQN09006.1 hypothetical protein M1R55_20690 [Deinococcus sp. QL22]